jgi:hypothetical protein
LKPMLSETQIRVALTGVNWNFPAVTTLSTSVHSLHWFPGNFIPQIPSFLIQALSAPSSVIADPFCGSGTTGVEAALIGRNAWLSDTNRISCLISRAKLLILTDPSLRLAVSELSDPLEWSFLQQTDEVGLRGEGASQELGAWYHPDTRAQLRSIWRRIETVSSESLRTVLEMLFSDLLFTCASAGRPQTSGKAKRKHHWGWIADNVRPKTLIWHDARRLFFNLLKKTDEVLKATPLLTGMEITCSQADARSLPIASSSVDLVVTSPPYFGMIDYANANRLTYLWFGWPIEDDRLQEIGARSRRKRGSAPLDYLTAIEYSVVEITRVLKVGGFCAIVIGASRRFPSVTTNVIECFSRHMNLVWGPEGRTPSRRRVAERQGTMPSEFVCVFRKGK